MSGELTAATLTEETEEKGEDIPFGLLSVSDDQTGLVSRETIYIRTTDLDKERPQPASSRRGFERESLKALESDDREILNLAFDRISQALQADFQEAELSNCFDEWKDLLEEASRKVGSFTSNHRKILGSLLSVLGGKDISDFDNESLRTFQNATNILRLPRASRQDAGRIITDLLKQKKKILMPLAIEESVKDRTEVLNDMMAQLIRKSRNDQ
ncbi:MAG: hypothetical protein A2156_04035 [Deltaproteobacteria bacterium RBG_16_48_10]|nr:MAG: hypothetical protein A2156_04035 [Deltaproteobacteria bacterium RBG_16_48_10]